MAQPADDTKPPGYAATAVPAGNGRPDSQENSVLVQAEKTPERPPHHGHQNLVFTDPVAFRYLEEDPSTVVLTRRGRLSGYEIYIVEQWACSRVHPTFIITTYTGDPSHSVVVGVLSVPTDEGTWSPRLKVYLNAVSQFHARKKETPLGNLMVTNLSAFPSALTVIAVPDGDVKRHREDFIANVDLKRLNCSGRAGLNLQTPTAATEAKFYQLYRMSERVPIYEAVLGLVKQCQMALTVFDKLAPEYVDGLLCDVTENAINEWWNDIGTDFFNVDPTDGILGPTTVSALLGLLMGARNRLHAYGSPVGKDAFDIASLKRGIGSFQKSQRLERNRRLDRQTLDRLHRVTTKAASGEGWTVPRAVKSTVAELSAKGGEMVKGMVGGREKAGIAEIETLDIDRFAHLVSGEQAKWLWHGKPRKQGSELLGRNTDDGEMIFTRDDQGRYIWARTRDADPDNTVNHQTHEPQSAKPQELQSALDDIQFRKAVRRTVTDRVSDARAGFGRFKDAVGLPGLRSHHHKQSKEGVDLESDLAYQSSMDSDLEPHVPGVTSEPLEQKPLTSNDSAGLDPTPTQAIASDHSSATQHLSAESNPSRASSRVHKAHDNPSVESLQPPELSLTRTKTQDADGMGAQLEMMDTISSTRETGLVSENVDGHTWMCLRRSQSHDSLISPERYGQKNLRWPRHLSFSTVEETVLTWEDVYERPRSPELTDANLPEAIATEGVLASNSRIFSDRVIKLDQHTASWVKFQVGAVEELERRTEDGQSELNALYVERLEAYQTLRSTSTDLVARESALLTDETRKIELLGAKLDYELNVLQSKVEDLEDGLADYERHIVDIEARIKELVQDEERNNKTSWFSWTTGIFGRQD